MSTEEIGKDEVYYHEVIARDEIDRLFSPKVFTSTKRFTKEGIEENITDFNVKDNLIIKGNNLIALHSLSVRYAGKVKLIYIDPPYNTDNDGFKYNDRFKRSTWLTFMKNRLELARKFLRNDGVIFVQCDDKEQAYLKVLMDTIFGEENFVRTLAVKMSTVSGVKTSHREKTILKEKELIHIYAKNKDLIQLKPQYLPVYEWDNEFNFYLEKQNSEDVSNWRVLNLRDVLRERQIPYDPDDESFKKFVNENKHLIWRRAFIRNKFKQISLERPNEVIRNEANGKEHLYYRGRELFFLKDKDNECFTEEGVVNHQSILLADMWMDINTSKLFNEGDVDFRNGKKPEFLIARILDLTTMTNDIVLDFHLGSGTTATVAHKMNRQYIGIEQMDYIKKLAVPRLQKVIGGEQGGISKAVNWQGGGSFVYAELMQLNDYFVDAITKAQSYQELEKLFQIMRTEAHLNYQIELEQVLNQTHEIEGETHLVAFKDLDLDCQKRLLIELLDKNQLYVNASDIDDVERQVAESDKLFTKSFYSIQNND
ncbi:hypothetical protein AAEX37_01728 [Oligella sp. MSHR50489EDL]|uniref:site-specific DNA-methyltransferase n=1 Tax=Oligella sp. MSHR50489EDL TaxID=3139409 RepID=UPI003D817A12